MKPSLLSSLGRRARCALAACAVACSVISLSAAEPRTVPGLELTLMPIPAGTFMMASPGSVGPQTRLTISQPFWLGRTEVTQGQWKALMGTDVVEQVRRQLADDTLTRNAGLPLRQRDGAEVNRTNVSDPHELVYNTADNAPMYWVSWDEAVEFCRRLTERERAEGRVPLGYEYRLPTGAEWEYAARAGTTTATYAGELEIKGFANAPMLDPIAWYRGNSSEGYTGKGMDTSAWPEKQFPGGIAGPHAVATKRPNAWGLYDMLGNVWEWCGDWGSAGPADKLPGGSVRDPTGPASGPLRGMRGGSWGARPGLIHAAAVAGNLPTLREHSLGFRVALAPQLSERPGPAIVTPGEVTIREPLGLLAPAPSDAIVLFDGKDLSKWSDENGGEAKWKLNTGAIESVPGAGMIRTRDKFTDFQLHLDFRTPVQKVEGSKEGRPVPDSGYIGVVINGIYGIQIPYADGQVAALDGQHPPLVNASRPPGIWQSYEIIFESPRWNPAGELVKKATISVIQNGVVVHHRQESLERIDGSGAVADKSLGAYGRPHPPAVFIELQDHSSSVHLLFRHIWVRELRLPETPEARP